MSRSHVIDYQIKGESIQIVEVELDPMETVIAEAGAMLFMEDGITFEAKMGDGSNPNQGLFDKLLSVGSRVLTGESLFMTHFTNSGTGKRKLAFAVATSWYSPVAGAVKMARPFASSASGAPACRRAASATADRARTEAIPLVATTCDGGAGA